MSETETWENLRLGAHILLHLFQSAPLIYFSDLGFSFFPMLIFFPCFFFYVVPISIPPGFSLLFVQCCYKWRIIYPWTHLFNHHVVLLFWRHIGFFLIVITNMSQLALTFEDKAFVLMRLQKRRIISTSAIHFLLAFFFTSVWAYKSWALSLRTMPFLHCVSHH